MEFGTYWKCIHYHEEKEVLKSNEFIDKLNDALSLIPITNRQVLDERFEKLINERLLEIDHEIAEL